MVKTSVIVDENLSPHMAVELARSYNVILMRRGVQDDEIRRYAHDHGALILTKDKGFLDCPEAVYCSSQNMRTIKRLLDERLR